MKKIVIRPAEPEPQPVATWQESLFGGPGAESTLRQAPLFGDVPLAELAARRAAAKRSHAKRFAEWFGEERDSA